jgi:hypothetical protein
MLKPRGRHSVFSIAEGPRCPATQPAEVATDGRSRGITPHTKTRKDNRMRPIVIAWALCTFCVAPTAQAQRAPAPPAGWAFGAGGMAMHWSDNGAPFDVLGGPALQVSRLTPGGLGIDIRGAYLLPSGFYNLTGVSGIAGLSYGIPAGRALVLVKGGITGLLGGDSDGSVYGGGGGYGGLGVVFPVAGRLGVHLEALARGLKTGDGGIFAPSAAAGLMWLPHK